jgi:hypothetical protein
MDSRIMMRIGNRTFTATLSDNATAAAFRKLLPLSVAMTELNGNEKFARLAVRLPIRPSAPPTIRVGDLMMYGDNTLVLFYPSLATTYSYTDVGRVDDPAGLDATLGFGNIDVTFAAQGGRQR